MYLTVQQILDILRSIPVEKRNLPCCLVGDAVFDQVELLSTAGRIATVKANDMLSGDAENLEIGQEYVAFITE